MIKKVLVVAFASLLTFAFNAFANSQEEVESQCRQYASEEGIPAHELEDYMSQCIQDLLSESESNSDRG